MIINNELLKINHPIMHSKMTRITCVYRYIAGESINIGITIVLLCLLSSCAEVKKEDVIKKTAVPVIKITPAEEVSYKKKIKEWEDYLSAGQIETPESFIDTVIRLTDEYFDAKETFYKKDMDSYEQMLILFQKGVIKTEPREPKQDYATLIINFKKLMEQYPYRNGADSICYALAYALYEQGDREKAIEYFEYLIKNYPRSDYILEVSFRLGEYFFETMQLLEAKEAYSRILSNPQSVFYEKAAYKLGWIYFKLDDFKNASEAFITVADRGGGLTEDAVTAIVMSLSRFKNAELSSMEHSYGIQYMQSKGIRGYTSSVIIKLGDRLAEETRYDAAIITYASLFKLFPTHPSLPFVYEKMADIYDRTGDEEKALVTRWDIVSKFNPLTLWYSKIYPNGSDDIKKLVSKTLISVSKKYHIKGKNNLDKSNYDDINKAIEGYKIFITAYPNVEEFKEVSLLLAEAQFDAMKYNDAVLGYEKAAALFPEGQRRADIVHSEFLTYEILFYPSDEESKNKIMTNIEDILEKYKSDLSKDVRLEKILYKTADMYGQLGNVNKAKEKLLLLAKGKDAQRAYEKLAGLYIKEGSLKLAEDVFLKMADVFKNPNIKKTELVELRYSIAEELQKAGKESEAIKKYEQAFNTDPGSKIGEAALIRLTAIYIRNRNMTDVEKTVNQIIKIYPGSESSISMLVDSGRKLEKDEPLTAAKLYEYASSMSKERSDADKLLLAAGILNENNGVNIKAEALFKSYLNNNIEHSDNIPEIRYRLASVQIALGKRNDGLKTLNSLFEEKWKMDEALEARVRLLIIKEKQRVYSELKLMQPFEKTLKEKTELLDVLLNDYAKIIQYNDAELTLDIFYHMGAALENFKDSIVSSEKPKDMSKEEIEEYNILLWEKADPYEEQAVKTYEKCLAVGRKQLIYSEWVEKSLIRLASIRPAIFKRVFETKDAELLFAYPEPVAFKK